MRTKGELVSLPFRVKVMMACDRKGYPPAIAAQTGDPLDPLLPGDFVPNAGLVSAYREIEGERSNAACQLRVRHGCAL